MSDKLKKQAGHALVWNFLDKGGQQIIQLVFLFVLMRVLETSDFGLIAVLAIFSAIAGILQESGFTSALLRKKEVSQAEYTSVFYFNISISVTLYIIFFLCAPLISRFYGNDVLTNLSRFIFLTFVFSAFGIIQNVNLIREMNFRINTGITLVAGVISGTVAIIMALNGYGAWSLATQVVLQSFLRSILLWKFIKWRPSGRFYINYIRDKISYSSRLLLAGIMNQICNNIFPILMGKFYGMSQAGSYGQANKLNMIPQSIISDSLKTVAFPILTKIDDDEDRKVKAFRKIIRVTAFVSFPVAMMLIVMAEPLILSLFTSKWRDSIPFVQLVAIGGSVFPLVTLMGTVLQSKGKSNSILQIEGIRNVLMIVSILCFIRTGIHGMVAGLSLVNIISLFISGYYMQKVFAYKLKEILTDIMPYAIIAIISFLPLYFIFQSVENNYISAVLQFILGNGIYLLITKFLGSKVIEDCIAMFKRKL